jgi:hypothetical protein
MSVDSTSDDEQTEVDYQAVSEVAGTPYDPEGKIDEADEAVSEVVRKPIRTAGDLSEVADASPGIITDDLARDLETLTSKPGAPSERELLLEILWRLRRIEDSPKRAFLKCAHRGSTARLRTCSASLSTVCGGWRATSLRSVNSASVFAGSRKHSPTSVLTAGLAVSLRSQLCP